MIIEIGPELATVLKTLFFALTCVFFLVFVYRIIKVGESEISDKSYFQDYKNFKDCITNYRDLDYSKGSIVSKKNDE